MPAVLHEGKFERNLKPPYQWRFICSCGFTTEGEEHQVQTRAAVHDLYIVDDKDGEGGVKA